MGRSRVTGTPCEGMMVVGTQPKLVGLVTVTPHHIRQLAWPVASDSQFLRRSLM